MEKWRKEELTDKIINACINVHKELGPGFFRDGNRVRPHSSPPTIM